MSIYDEAYKKRIPLLAATVGHAISPQLGLKVTLRQLINPKDYAQVWLAFAVLTGRLPTEELVIETARRAQFDSDYFANAIVAHTTPESAKWPITIESDRPLVELADTIANPVMSGIQRVVRESAKRWIADHPEARFIAWGGDWEAIRDLSQRELEQVRAGASPAQRPQKPTDFTVVVPWHTQYLLPEISGESQRADRLRAAARFGAIRGTAIGYDMVPVSAVEYISPGLGDLFARYYTVLRYFTRIATISGAAATEFLGWREMLSGAGFSGPDIKPILLPVVAQAVTADELEAARKELLVGDLPMILVVGSHEPRKNHAAIIDAAEELWREGLEFSLTFIGAHSWGNQLFEQRLEELLAAGRPIKVIHRAADSLLWAAYRLARFSVFTSFNEGFGLPVAESLAVGVPVLTTNYGSTKEIADGGGALLVDPRNSDEIVAGMRALLTDDDLLARLETEALSRENPTWDDYAAQTWDYLISEPDLS
jgi:glycosyltransferase involved in cell wall biosynthesis